MYDLQHGSHVGSGLRRQARSISDLGRVDSARVEMLERNFVSQEQSDELRPQQDKGVKGEARDCRNQMVRDRLIAAPEEDEKKATAGDEEQKGEVAALWRSRKRKRQDPEDGISGTLPRKRLRVS